MEERFELLKNRIEEIPGEKILPSRIQEYFVSEAEFILYVLKIYGYKKNDELCKLDYSTLKRDNTYLYTHKVDITYGSCESESEKYLVMLDGELKAMIPYAYEGNLHNLLIRMELFLEVYSAYLCAAEDGLKEPKELSLKDIFFYYVSDYTDEDTEERIHDMLIPEDDFASKIIMNADFSDMRSLYLFGEYVTENEEKTLEHINSLPYETLKKMADTFTEGYRIGFEVTNKDITKKKTVGIRYTLGFEPVIKLAIANFEKIGLKPTITRARFNLLKGRGIVKVGYFGACPDRQYDFEHKDDAALFYDARLNTIRLEALGRAFEKYKSEARLYGGPAVMEVFGEKAPDYVTVKEAPSYSKEQRELRVKYTSEAGMLQNKYIIEEERSFTIIAFPTPEIGEEFGEIFDEVIKLNTLDYMLYRNVQQTIIDTLDKGNYAIVKGGNGNKTDLRISLHKLENPDKQTKFENCVADVNIPVGEVFTSPVLAGTEGVLNVSKVYLNGLEYKNIMLTIKDGKVEDYSCENFPTMDENRKYIKDNILYNHETLPMGEFAIGTNTTAYMMGRRFNIEDKLPILIAEKTGPHFAFGDTCYSHCEDVKVYNPDGKEIISRDNEISLLRKEDPGKAYFNCHTDITIPYDELRELSIVTYDEEVIPIILEGRFVLPGTDVLNEALDSSGK